MSKWTEFRDDVVKALNFDKVTEEMKREFTVWLVETCLPLAEDAAAKFTSQTKEQAKNEVGWCKMRDFIVLPFVINGGLWAIKKALTANAAKA